MNGGAGAEIPTDLPSDCLYAGLEFGGGDQDGRVHGRFPFRTARCCAAASTSLRTRSAMARASRSTDSRLSVVTLRSLIRMRPATIVVWTSSPRDTYTRC